MISGTLNNAQALTVRVDYLEDTSGMNIKMCQDDANSGCQDVSPLGVDLSDREWRVKDLTVAANTNHVYNLYVHSFD
jgi:hypothetical protein